MNLQHLLDQAVALHREGHAAQAEQLYAQVLLAVPDNAIILFNHGTALRDMGRYTQALARFDQVIAIQSGFAAAFINRGNCLRHLGRTQEALASFVTAAALEPGDAGIQLNHAVTLADLGRFEEALTSYDAALAIKPDYFQALNGRGLALSALRRFEEALASYDAALAIEPGYLEALHNRGQALSELKRFEKAMASFEAALAIEPDIAAIWNNLGLLQSEIGRFEDALASFDKALAIDPHDADALYNRGRQLLLLKRLPQALASFESVLAADPSSADAFAGLAETALRLCDWTRTEKIAGELKAGIRAGKAVIAPFFFQGYSGDPALQLQCAKNQVRSRIPVPPRPLWTGAANRNGKIKIAYLSADFHEHPTAYLMAELFERHDRSRFEVSALSFGLDDGSPMRARLVRAFDHFTDVRRMSDLEAALHLKESGIDIAIDLKGHTENNRLGILSHRPAPVQVNYLGYPGTLGADFIDYVIGDAIVAPFDQQAFFSEKIVHLPGSYQVNDSSRRAATGAPSRKAAGLPEQGFVFCCFNNSWKIAAPLFEIWMRLLKAVPGSVLWLFDTGIQDHLRAQAAKRGIDPARLVFAARTGLAEHLARHRLADLFLDTLPYNAHTTASDALWAGLPLVTCLGESFCGRVAASLLHAASLPELVVHNLADYEALALKLAQDENLLRSFRQRLEQNRLTCPLFDTDQFRRNIEAAYAKMREIARRGAPPESFAIGNEL